MSTARHFEDKLHSSDSRVDRWYSIHPKPEYILDVIREGFVEL